jgi:diguanylate cyclase (GGDEF)-like protein
VATETPTRDGAQEGVGKLARELFADAAQRLADEFGSVAATAVGTLGEVAEPVAPAPAPAPAPAEGEHPSLYRPGQLRRRLDQLLECRRRYQQRFALVVFDVEGPGARADEAGDRQTALAVVGAALGDSTRLVDEAFRLEEDALCVLAPGQDTIGGVQMAERLLDQLDDLERAGGLRIGISAGVVACPDHGEDAEALLRKADEAMWRARSVGQPVGVGVLQDR